MPRSETFLFSAFRSCATVSSNLPVTSGGPSIKSVTLPSIARAIVKASNRPGTPIPPGTREERLAWIDRMLGGKG
jgi:hypothetical protein